MPQDSNVRALPGSEERLEQMLEASNLDGWRERGVVEAEERKKGARDMHGSRIRYHDRWMLPLVIVAVALALATTFVSTPWIGQGLLFALEAVLIAFGHHWWRSEWHTKLLKELGPPTSK